MVSDAVGGCVMVAVWVADRELDRETLWETVLVGAGVIVGEAVADTLADSDGLVEELRDTEAVADGL